MNSVAAENLQFAADRRFHEALAHGIGFRVLVLRAPLPARAEKRFYVLTGIGALATLNLGIAAFVLRAEDALQTFALKQLDFVSAVTGNPQAAIVADGLVQERLSEDVARA